MSKKWINTKAKKSKGRRKRKRNWERHYEYMTKYWKEHPEDRKRYNFAQRLKTAFGMTVDDYQQMLLAQGGKCAICSTIHWGNQKNNRPLGPSVDHDHRTGRNRGLLCSHCNLTLGLLNDDPLIFEAAASYLRRFQ